MHFRFVINKFHLLHAVFVSHIDGLFEVDRLLTRKTSRLLDINVTFGVPEALVAVETSTRVQQKSFSHLFKNITYNSICCTYREFFRSFFNLNLNL